MKSLKSIQVKEINSGLPGNILSTSVNKDTGRRVTYCPETGFSHSKKSRANKFCAICNLPMSPASRGLTHGKCYFEARKTTYVIKCSFCGKEFERPRYVHEKALKLCCVDAYCSKKCSQAHHAVKNSRQFFCRTCGMEIGKGQRYCSPDCKHKALTGNRKKLNNKICLMCLDEFMPRSSRSTYCSPMCKNLAHSLRMAGAGNSRYKNGMSYAKHFREIRPLILERDSHSCAQCGIQECTKIIQHPINKKRSNLSIHHIDLNPRNNMAENLVALCQRCHAIHHHSLMTPFKALQEIALKNTTSMTSKLREQITSLQTGYLSIIATSE